jgi:hypothetical protein
MQVFVDQIPFGEFADQSLAEEVLARAGIATERVSYALHAAESRSLCAAHITASYPQHKQLNILRSGNTDDIVRMGKFIDACRDWSNGSTPDPAQLGAIKP